MYGKLIAQSRNVGGVVGDGGLTVAESQIAIGGLERSVVGQPGDGGVLHRLQRLFMHTDARIAATIERRSGSGSTSSR